MSKLIARLHQHPLHNVAHYKPYLERYHHDTFRLLDHYRHLQQLLPIYQALEAKLLHSDFVAILPEHLHFALTRSKEIEKDLAALASLIPNVQSNQLLDSTQAYVTYLNSLDPSTPQGLSTLFSHFLLRILGDLFGGQGLKQGVTDALARESSNCQDEFGRQFYVFPERALQNFSRWLKDFNEIDEEAVVESATNAYQRNINIFDELEATRAIPVNRLASISRNASSFFNCSNITKAVAIGAATLATGVVISRFGM